MKEPCTFSCSGTGPRDRWEYVASKTLGLMIAIFKWHAAVRSCVWVAQRDLPSSK